MLTEDAMKIYVYIDPEYKQSIWLSQAYHSICEEAAKKKYNVILLDGDNIFNADIDEYFKGESKRVLLVLTTSLEHSEKLGALLFRHNVHMLLVNHQNPQIANNSSCVMVDYTDGMRRIIDYLCACGKSSTALYGINPKSSTDMIKYEYFKNLQGMSYSHESSIAKSIYYNKHGLDECFNYMLPELDKFDSFICANDIVARSLISKLQAIGKRVPEDVFVISFGDYLISQMGEPTLTTISVDHGELGRQALFAYRYLHKADTNINMTAKVPSTLFVRNSTANMNPEISTERKYVPAPTEKVLDFYNDDASRKILALEKMLTSCDKLDLQIISGMLNKIPYSKMASGLFISENVIFYRIKRLVKVAEAENKEQLITLITEHLSQKEISEYIEADSMK